MPDDALSNTPPVFVCPRQPGNLTLTPDACARLYRRGLTTDPGMAIHCRGCRIGAEHAELPVIALPERLSCCWCGKSVGEARRLVLGKTLCPSCHARLSEHARQGYRRHGPTGVAQRLHVFTVEIEDSTDGSNRGCTDT